MCFTCGLYIINSINESSYFMFSYNVPIGSRKLECGSKPNHLIEEKGGVIPLRVLCVVTTILISCDQYVDVVFQEHFVIIVL